MMNVFVMPSDVFEELRHHRMAVANWLVPLALACLVATGSVLVLFSQESIWQQIREQQVQATEKRLEQMPPDQREQARSVVEMFSRPIVMKIFAIAGAVVVSLAGLFLITLLVWLLGRWVFRAEMGFGKTLEMCGLAGLVGTLGTVVKTLLIAATGNLYASPSPAMLLPHVEATDRLFQVLSVFNVMTIWYIVVLAIGLSRLSRIVLFHSFLWLFVPWMVFGLGLIWIQGAPSGM